MGDVGEVLTSPFRLVTDAVGLTGGKGGGSVPGQSLANQAQVSEKERIAERRRRQIILNQNRLIQTTALGASVRDQTLGGKVLLAGS